MTGALAAEVTVQRASFGLGATALYYPEAPSPIRRRLSRNSKSKRGIHNLGSGRQVIAADNCRRRDWPK